MNLLNLLMGNRDPRDEEYRRWLQLRGGGGVPNIEDYRTVVPEAGPAPEEITMDQAGYDEAMQNYDWKRKLEEMESSRFYASLANLFAPRYPKQPKAISVGPASRPFVDLPQMRWW
jgi:hypothetical protein